MAAPGAFVHFVKSTKEDQILGSWRSRCRRAALAIWIIGLISFVSAAQGQNLNAAPTTTLAAESGNNTSAADVFVSTNGNANGGNVSKLPLRDLLYDHAATKIYAHFVGWFGGRDHIDVGYESADPLQVQKQVADMVSRGIDGVVVDWYGPSFSNRSETARNTEVATQALMQEAENISGFEFAIMVDKGALHNCHEECDATHELIRQLTYVHDTYQKSPAYMRVNGRPVVFFFGVASRYNIDWKRVARRVPGDPLFIQQDKNSGDDRDSRGGYAWVKLGDRESARDWSGKYLSWFYREGKNGGDAPSLFGAVYKGFDDSMASWSEKRLMSQDCGRTWLKTWAAISDNYSVAEPLPALQLVTWNDYEEGTELESGIDNCVAINTWHSGDGVKWNLRWSEGKHADIVKNGPGRKEDDGDRHDSRVRSGFSAKAQPEDGVDHFAIFVSSDRQNLTQVAEVPSGERAFNIGSLQLLAGRYYVYVKAVGKPGLLNHMSGPITFEFAPQP